MSTFRDTARRKETVTDARARGAGPRGARPEEDPEGSRWKN